MAKLTVENASKASIHNRAALLAAQSAGCYYCLQIIDPRHIKEWVDLVPRKGKVPPDQTGMCPNCGADALLPNVDDKAFLRECYDYWFTVQRA